MDHKMRENTNLTQKEMVLQKNGQHGLPVINYIRHIRCIEKTQQSNYV